MIPPVVADENIVFNLAEAFISQTSRPVFLTGKAGTGKTTFLKHIKRTTTKKALIVAPTGVAAIHAGGTTIHSFFQLPFTPFLPDVQKGSVPSGDMSDRFSLINNMKVEAEKRKLFREMELLIIDEVSMVRCDILDAMDTVLRHFRRKPFVPFGGVQVLFIGDLFQLPPVAPDDQWEILKHYYEGPFFFDSHVLRKSRPLYIELKKIYRQSDERFISILNNIRGNEVEEEDLLMLNERYQPAFEPPDGENYITLTTHNHKADTINASALAKLSTTLSQFEGIVEGDFPERNFPTDRILNLKAGAQVMFIKNDMEKVRRYYNGKIGTIKRIEADRIVVGFPHEENELEVEKDTWNNIRYTFNPKTRQVEEEVLGTFTQYAIRLAWAITIHKSQGLTFSKAIIDAGKSFAPGQVYVALSRCTSLEGIVLYSRIFRNSIMTDERVIRFAEEESSPEELRPILQVEQQQYALNTLMDFFDWRNIITELENFKEQLAHRKFQRKKKADELFESLMPVAQEQHLIAQKFQEQLKNLFRDASTQEDYRFLTSRVTSACNYFRDQFDSVFLNPLVNHQKELTGKAGVKGYRKQLKTIISFFSLEKERLQSALDITHTIVTRLESL